MVRASDLFFSEKAFEHTGEAAYFTPSNLVTYANYFLDILVTPIYSYQSVPVGTNTGTLIKYVQMLRSEVLDNAHLGAPTVALDQNGVTWAWGNNLFGQLGNNTSGVTSSSVPVSVIGGRTFSQVAAGCSSSSNNQGYGTVCALDKDGFAWGWGWNSTGPMGEIGIIGDNTNTNRSSPVSVVGGYQFVTLNNTHQAFCGLDISGFAWTWGSNTTGQLGDGTTTNRSSPVSVIGGNNFVAVANTIGVDVNGFCWTWGGNANGQLGDGTTTAKSSPVLMLGVPGTSGTITQVDAAADANPSFTNGNAKIALTSSGYAYTVGDNTYGALGDGTITSRSSAVSVIGGYKFSQVIVASGVFGNGPSMYGLDYNGFMWAWGYNNYGQLGDGTTANRSSPVSVRAGNRKYAQIYGQYGTTMAVDMDGNIWLWGSMPWGNPGSITVSNPALFNGIKAVVRKY